MSEYAIAADGLTKVFKTRSGLVTAVSELDHPGRVNELADMLGTQNEHARGGAESILLEAAQAKQ